MCVYKYIFHIYTYMLYLMYKVCFIYRITVTNPKKVLIASDKFI